MPRYAQPSTVAARVDALAARIGRPTGPTLAADRPHLKLLVRYLDIVTAQPDTDAATRAARKAFVLLKGERKPGLLAWLSAGEDRHEDRKFWDAVDGLADQAARKRSIGDLRERDPG